MLEFFQNITINEPSPALPAMKKRSGMLRLSPLLSLVDCSSVLVSYTAFAEEIRIDPVPPLFTVPGLLR